MATIPSNVEPLPRTHGPGFAKATPGEGDASRLYKLSSIPSLGADFWGKGIVAK